MKIFFSSEMENRKLGMNIRVARKRRKMSLAELSAKSSVSKTVLRRIEEGDTSVGIGKVFNVLDALALLKRISDIANPDLDREQTFNEIKNLREEKVVSRQKKKAKRFVRTF